ncbi:hypothetical protein DIURU_005469 [Diutina rugosa]|uniref:Magnesium transporter n=1 Tax=Diutina rugosa TaxID=5481 RepID=A0A642UD16_DIURU|nr:uncharacterized protein DIURU_005469 [Diutina rugosa]KAA8896956.1 hypothetical protein DIURU_005469 [Diutina rugosa]
MILLGCIVAVVSSAIQSLGITFQRKSHIDIGAPHYRNQTLWFMGFAMFIVANVLGSLIQISTLPLIILSPLQSIGLIFNSVFSCMLLNESFTPKLGWGTAVIAVGATIIAYNGQTPEHHDSLKIVVDKLLRPAFFSWFIVTIAVVIILFAFNYWLIRSRVVRGFIFGIISGILTAHTFLFAKSIVDSVISSLKSALGNPVCYILLLLMLTIIGFQLTAFNLGLKQLSTSILYPFCFFVFNLVNLINDVVFNSVPMSSSLVWVIIGLVAVLIGVLLISWDSVDEEEARAREREPLVRKRVLSYEQSQLMNSYIHD